MTRKPMTPKQQVQNDKANAGLCALEGCASKRYSPFTVCDAHMPGGPNRKRSTGPDLLKSTFELRR